MYDNYCHYQIAAILYMREMREVCVCVCVCVCLCVCACVVCFCGAYSGVVWCGRSLVCTRTALLTEVALNPNPFFFFRSTSPLFFISSAALMQHSSLLLHLFFLSLGLNSLLPPLLASSLVSTSVLLSYIFSSTVQPVLPSSFGGSTPCSVFYRFTFVSDAFFSQHLSLCCIVWVWSVCVCVCVWVWVWVCVCVYLSVCGCLCEISLKDSLNIERAGWSLIPVFFMLASQKISP